MANDPSIIDQSGAKVEDTLRRLHVRDKICNLHVDVSAFILISLQLLRIEWQGYAYRLQLTLLHLAKTNWQFIVSSSFLIVKL